MIIPIRDNNYKLSQDALDMLHSWGYTSISSGNTLHTHPVSALVRNSFETWVVREHPGAAIKDVGGNYARHARKKHTTVHSCCPYLGPSDVVREVTRDYVTGGNYCRNKFDSCLVKSSVYMFNHSMYYITPNELLCIPEGATIYASHHVYPGPGVYMGGELKVTRLGNGNYRTVAKGNDTPYEHPNCWLSGECVIPGANGTVIAFKLLQTNCTCMTFKGRVMRVPNPTSMMMQPTHNTRNTYSSALYKVLLAEVVGSTLDTKTVHLLHMRAKTWCMTKSVDIPDDLTPMITAVINEAAVKTMDMARDLHLEDISTNNTLVRDLHARLDTDTWLKRLGGMMYGMMAGILYCSAYQIGVTTGTAKSRMVNIMRYATARLTQIAWYKSADYLVPEPTFIPNRDWESELQSIVARALSPVMSPVIDERIYEKAKSLATSIGRIPMPIDFDTWLLRYPEHKRVRYQNATMRALSTNIDMFVKVEQLDKQADPRAIQARHDSFKAAVGPWIAALEARCCAVLPCMIKALSEEGKAEKISTLRDRADNTLEIDFSRFDRHCSKTLLVATEHAVYEHVFPEHVAAMLRMQLDNNCTSAFGAKYHVEGGRMSGDMNTSIGNCIIVACLMMAAGLPLDSFIVEGDDMFAAVTDHEKKNFNLAIISNTGMKPEYISTYRQGTFCSRWDVVDSRGAPKRVRHPLRDIVRYGFTLGNTSRLEKVMTHAREWNGVPMLGPVYYRRVLELKPDEISNPEWITTITPSARLKFDLTFNINIDTQIAFEDDQNARPTIYEQLKDAQAGIAPVCTTPTRNGGSEIPRAIDIDRQAGDDLLVIPARIKRVESPRPASIDVRNVQAPRTGEVFVQSSSGNHHERRTAHGRGLRRTRGNNVLPGDSSLKSKEHGSCVARPDNGCTTSPCHEDQMAINK